MFGHCRNFDRINFCKTMKKAYVYGGLFILLLLANLVSSGQTGRDSLIYRIETTDGNEYFGKIISEDSEKIVIQTENIGQITLLTANIKKRTLLKSSEQRNGEYWPENQQSSRYFWSPNGYGLKTGEAYYQNIWIFYNQVSVGLTNTFSLGAGIIPLFLIEGAPTPIWLIPKFSIPLAKDKINLGIGSLLGTVAGGEDSGIFGLVYGTTTFGSRDKNFSIGMAYGFAEDEWTSTPLINLSALIRISRRGYFITENYLIISEGDAVAMLSAGGRSILGGIGLDYSLWLPLGGDSFVLMPFLGITIPIGRID